MLLCGYGGQQSKGALEVFGVLPNPKAGGRQRMTPVEKSGRLLLMQQEASLRQHWEPVLVSATLARPGVGVGSVVVLTRGDDATKSIDYYGQRNMFGFGDQAVAPNQEAMGCRRRHQSNGWPQHPTKRLDEADLPYLACPRVDSMQCD